MLIYLLQGILTMSGHRVITAPDATTAMQRWAEHHGEIDLVITDMVMPGGISGRDLSEMLLTESPTLPIIFTSGYSPDFAGADLTLTPGVNFLPKPYTSQAVLEIVERMLARKRDAANSQPERRPAGARSSRPRALHRRGNKRPPAPE